ncbi:MAG: DUF1631 domain-containing protein [Burkholderiaceae bacterium]|nr:DUF1631 domain-containing protein [Burkholderiaceae bacterium]
MNVATRTQTSGHFVDLRALLGARLRRVVADALVLIPGALEAAGERAGNPRDRHALYSAASLLRIDATERSGGVPASFDERVRRCLALAAIANPDERALALIDEDELDAQILAVELAGAVRANSGAAYADYTQRVRSISRDGWTDDDFNPLGARTLASAAVVAFGGAASAPVAKAALRSLLRQHLAAPLAALITAANARMIHLGIKPAPGPAAVKIDRRADESPAGQAAGAPRQETTPEAAAPQMPPAPDRGQNRSSARAPLALGSDRPDPAALASASASSAATLGTSALARESAENWRSVLPMLRPVIEIERDAVDFARSIDETPYSRGARSAYFGKVRDGLHAGGAASAQLAVVDLVAGMFDYVVDDNLIPEAARPLLWRLQQPAVALALLDAGYLGEEPRSLRRLIENIGAIASVNGDELITDSARARRLETTVRAVEVVTSALQTRSSVIANQVDKEYSRAAHNIEQLIERVMRERKVLESAPAGGNRRDYANRPSPEFEQDVTARIRQLLEQRLGETDVPDTAREFLMDVWLRHLRTAAMRDGEQSTEFQLAVGVIDELLWSLGARPQRVSKSELARKIPSLLRMLTKGTRDIGAREEEHKAFFDELFLIHLRKMHPQPLTGGASRVRNAFGATVTGLHASQFVQPPAGGGAATEVGAAPGSAAEKVPAAGRGERFEEVSASGAAGAAEERAAAATPYGRRASDEPPAGAMLFDVLPPLPSALHRVPSEEMQRWGSADSGPKKSGEQEWEALGDTKTVKPFGRSEPERSEDRKSSEAANSNQRLLDILKSLDLDDLPDEPRHVAFDPEHVFRQINRGVWLEFTEAGNGPSYLKVAWVNRRRTVALLVRRSDRRAVSIRFSELQKRFARGRAHLIETRAQ